MNVTYEYRITNTKTGETFEGRSDECAIRLGIKRSSFLAMLSLQRRGVDRHPLWKIEVVKVIKPSGEVNYKNMPHEQTLCWQCLRSRLIAGVACSWAARFEPVDGWQAVETHRKTDYVGDETRSYCVKSCPQFLEG